MAVSYLPEPSDEPESLEERIERLRLAYRQKAAESAEAAAALNRALLEQSEAYRRYDQLFRHERGRVK